jgi:hypothetical protein
MRPCALLLSAAPPCPTPPSRHCAAGIAPSTARGTTGSRRIGRSARGCKQTASLGGSRAPATAARGALERVAFACRPCGLDSKRCGRYAGGLLPSAVQAVLKFLGFCTGDGPNFGVAPLTVEVCLCACHAWPMRTPFKRQNFGSLVSSCGRAAVQLQAQDRVELKADACIKGRQQCRHRKNHWQPLGQSQEDTNAPPVLLNSQTPVRLPSEHTEM